MSLAYCITQLGKYLIQLGKYTQKHAQTEHGCVYSHVTLTALPHGRRHGNESSLCITPATSPYLPHHTLLSTVAPDTARNPFLQ